MADKIPFDYLGAKKAGYSDSEIQSFLKEKYQFDFDITSAKKSGYSDNEISGYISDYEPVKKKDGTSGSQDSSMGGATVQKQANGFDSFVLSPEQEATAKKMSQDQFHPTEAPNLDDDPIGNVTRPYVDKAKKAQEEFKLLGNRGRNVSESVNQSNYGDRTQVNARGNTQAKLAHDTQTAFDDAQRVSNHITNTLFPNGEAAMTYLQQEYQKRDGKLPEDNETINIAVQKAANLQGLKKNIEDSQGDPRQAALNLARDNDEYLNGQISALEKNMGLDGRFGGINEYKNIVPNALQGRYVDMWLKQPDVDVLTKNDPELKKQVDYLRNGGLNEEFPDYAVQKYANEISRQREAEGGNNWFANPIFNNSKYLDHLADRMYKNDPVAMDFINKNLKGKWEGKIDTPGFMDEFGASAGNTFKGMFGTVKDIFGQGDSHAERVYNELEKNNKAVSSDPKGWHKIAGIAGNFAGMVGAMATVNPFLRGTGMSAAAVNKTIVPLAFYDHEKNDWAAKYPNDPDKADAGATISTLLYSIAPDIFPNQKVSQAIQNEFKGTIGKTLDAVKDLSLMGDKQKIVSELGGKLTSIIKETAKGSAKGAAEMVAINEAKAGLDHYFGLNEKEYNQRYNDDQVIDIARSMLIGGALPNYLSAYGNRHAAAESLYSISQNRGRYKDALLDQKLSPEELARKRSDIDLLADTKQQLDEQGISVDRQKRYLLEALLEKNEKEKVPENADSNIKKQSEEKIKQHQEVKEQILKGEEPAPLTKDEGHKFDESNPAPHEVIVNAAKADKLGAYSTMVRDNPELANDVLKDFAQQAYGITDKGEKLEGGSREGALSLQYGQDVVDAAKEAFPTPESTFKNESATEGTEYTKNGGNKVVDASGNPLVVYHGSRSSISDFDESKIGTNDKGFYGKGFYFAPTEGHAEMYTGDVGNKNANNVTGHNISIKNPLILDVKDSDKLYGKDIPEGFDGVIVMSQGHPYEYVVKTKSQIKSNESQGTEASPEANEPAKAGETNEPTLTIDEGAEKPPKIPEGEKVIAGDDDGNKVGVSHESLSKLAKKVGLPEPERGTVLTPKEYADRGRQLIKAGAKPYEIANEFKESGKISPDMISVARAHLEDLAKSMSQAGDKFGHDSKEYKDSVEEYRKWRDDVVKPMGTAGGATFTSLQGERDIDTGSFTALRTLKEEAQDDKPLTEKQIKEGKELSSKVASLSKEVDDLKQKLTDALDKSEKAGSPKSHKEKAKNLADKLRDQAKLSRPGTFSAATPASLVWDGAVEVVAKAIEVGGEITQAIANGVDFIKKSDWYKSLSAEQKQKAEEEFTKWQKEKSIAELTPEEKNVLKLEQQLKDLEEGKVKGAKDKRELSDREKELVKKIAEAKKELGLNQKVKPVSPSIPNTSGADRDYDLAVSLSDKKDNKFTPEEAKDIWDYAKRNYLDKGEDFDSMISKTAVDLGLRKEQVRDALTTPKGTKEITDAMYKKQSQRNAAIQMAKDWAKADKNNMIVKFLRTIPRFFFAAKVFGHGTVGMVTHSGINIYDPVEWKRYWPTFFKQFKFAYGNEANYEKAMQDLKNDPDFIFWKRNGLAVDPTERYDEYQYVSNIFKKIEEKSKFKVLGKEFAPGRALTAGDRGFNALKVYRLQRAKGLWEGLSNVEKADKNTPKELAKLVNHSTGTTGLKVSDAASTVFFAPNLELARWNKLIVDPAKAVKTFTSWKDATPAEKAAAKIVAKRAGRILATYVGALAVNQGLLSLSGSNQKINFANPMDSDWLKFKAGGRTIDLTGGMVSLLGFLTRLGHTATAPAKDLKNKSRKDEFMNQGYSYIGGKLSPFASTTKDLITHHDFAGNTLPFFDDKPLHSYNKKLSLNEYLMAQQTPIPVAEAFTDIHKQMEDEGVPKATTMQILKGILTGLIVGGTGAHVGEESLNRSAGELKLPDIVKKDLDRTKDTGFDAPKSIDKITIAGQKVDFSGKEEMEFDKLLLDNRQKVVDDYFSKNEASYKKLPDIARKHVLEILYDAGRQKAVEQMFDKHPELIKQVKDKHETLSKEATQQLEERKNE